MSTDQFKLQTSASHRAPDRIDLLRESRERVHELEDKQVELEEKVEELESALEEAESRVVAAEKGAARAKNDHNHSAGALRMANILLIQRDRKLENIRVALESME